MLRKATILSSCDNRMKRVVTGRGEDELESGGTV